MTDTNKSAKLFFLFCKKLQKVLDLCCYVWYTIGIIKVWEDVKMYIALNEDVLEAVEKNLIEKMAKYVKSYCADFIVGLHWLERENKKGFATNKILVIFRENGCEMNYLNDERIQPWVNGDCSGYHYFLIDIDKAIKVDTCSSHKLAHYDYLSENGNECQCIYEVDKEAVQKLK